MATGAYQRAFYAAEASGRRVNLTNVLQLEVKFRTKSTLPPSVSEQITAQLAHWLTALDTR